MIVSLYLVLFLITGLTQALPYPQEIRNIDQIINASTNQPSSTITTQSSELPIELSVEHEQHSHQVKIDTPQDDQISGRSLDSSSNFNTNSGLLTSIFLNPAVRPTEQPKISHDDAMVTISDESSTDSRMLKPVQNEPTTINDTMTKVIAENVNHMEEINMNQKEEGQNDQPIMDEEIMMPENVSENVGHNHNMEGGNRKYTEINRDNQYLPINHHDNQYLPINHNDHQYSTVQNVHEIHQNNREHENDSDEDMHQSHADIKSSTEIHYDYTEMAMESSSVTSNINDNKSDIDNQIDMNKPQMAEPKTSSGNKLETIYKFGKITLLLYITYLCL